MNSHPTSRSGRLRLLIVGAMAFFGGLPAVAAFEILRLEAVNVTPSGFSIFWQASEAADPSLAVYADEGGLVEITTDVRIEFFPLTIGSMQLAHAYNDRAARRELQAKMQDGGLFLARVTFCQPATEYFVKAGAQTATGEVAMAPVGGLLRVKTAAHTAFVAESRQAIITFAEDDFDGSIVRLDTPGAASPLVAVVGDGGEPDRAYFNLSDFVDEESGTNLDFDSEAVLSVSLIAPGEALTSKPAAVGFSGGFVVAATTFLAFDPAVSIIAALEFEPIGPQLAGIPFAVTIRARDSDGNVAQGFSGSVQIVSDGRLVAGNETASFIEGELTGHSIVIGNTGDFRLSAAEALSGAVGESMPFPVGTFWENWLAVHVAPEDREASVWAQHRADPEGTGQPMLARYAFNMDGTPFHPPVREAMFAEGAERYLSVTFERLQYAPDIRYLVQASDNFEDWEVVEVVAPGSPKTVTVNDRRPVSASGRRFMRVALAGDDSYAFWAAGEFGVEALNDPETSARDADPGSHGVTNLERYALGMGSLSPDFQRMPVRRTVTDDGQDFQELSFERLARGEDVRYVIEATSNFPVWELIAEFGPGLPTQMVVRDTLPVPETGYRIIRLRIEPVSNFP